MPKVNRIGFLIFFYPNGLTPEEVKELNAWRSISEENEEEFQHLTNPETRLAMWEKLRRTIKQN